MDNQLFNASKYKNEFRRENYSRLEIIVKKGEKEEIQAHAKARGESVNSFVNRAIKQTLESDKI